MSDIATYKMELRRLRKFLEAKRAFARVAREAGVAHTTVTRVMNGQWVSLPVLDAARRVKESIEQEQAEVVAKGTKIIAA